MGGMQLIGLSRLNKAIRNVRLVIPKSVKTGMRRGANLIRMEARRRVPVKTGFLRSTIGAEIRIPKRDIVEAVAFATAFYAPFVEFGTSRNRAQPFLRPALEIKGPEAIKILKDILWRNARLAAKAAR